MDRQTQWHHAASMSARSLHRCPFNHQRYRSQVFRTPPPSFHLPRHIIHSSSLPSNQQLVFLQNIGFEEEASSLLLQQIPHPHTIPETCQALCDIGIPVSKLRSILSSTPELLSTPVHRIQERYSSLLDAWPSQQSLRKALINAPSMLLSDFPTNLNRCMVNLQDLGFSSAQSARALVMEPSLVFLRRYEIISSLKKCGFDDFKKSSKEIKEIISNVPQCVLLPKGSIRMRGLLDALEKACCMKRARGVHVLLYNTKIPKKVTEKDIKWLINAFKEYGWTNDQIEELLYEYPPLLMSKKDKIRLSLKLFTRYNVKIESILNYPRVFIHDPSRFIGPRLAFLATHGYVSCGFAPF